MTKTCLDVKRKESKDNLNLLASIENHHLQLVSRKYLNLIFTTSLGNMSVSSKARIQLIKKVHFLVFWILFQKVLNYAVVSKLLELHRPIRCPWKDHDISFVLEVFLLKLCRCDLMKT